MTTKVCFDVGILIDDFPVALQARGDLALCTRAQFKGLGFFLLAFSSWQVRELDTAQSRLSDALGRVRRGRGVACRVDMIHHMSLLGG